MSYQLKEEQGLKYLDEGRGEVVLLLHGWFGALSNWEAVLKAFSPTHRIIIPVMPIFEMPIKSATVEGLVNFIEGFVKFKDLNNMTLLGNSLGGHVGLAFTLRNKEKVKKIALTGSSGLFENTMGGS